MTEKRYTITLGKNNEFKEIIDHSKQDKHISVFDFLKQVGEQEKAFKKLKEENKELSEQVEYLKKQVKIFRGECNRLTKENTELLEELYD